MAGFSTHITVSTACGVGYGALGYAQGMPLTSCMVGAGLCSVAGMVPDLDGDTGVPVRETLSMVAAVIPALLLEQMVAHGMGKESLALTMVGIYLAIRFGFGWLFKHTTRHRGMWHSVPAALNVGLLVFLLCSGQTVEVRLFKAGAAVLGFLSHLVVDELYCVDVVRFRLKRSCGTAFKFWSQRFWPTVVTYGYLGVLTVLAYGQWRLLGGGVPNLEEMVTFPRATVEVIETGSPVAGPPAEAEAGN